MTAPAKPALLKSRQRGRQRIGLVVGVVADDEAGEGRRDEHQRLDGHDELEGDGDGDGHAQAHQGCVDGTTVKHPTLAGSGALA